MSETKVGTKSAGDRSEAKVTDMFGWREERANAAATAARTAYRERPHDSDAERAAYETMTQYIRAARQRTEAQRRARERQAQALADSLRNGSYVDPRPTR